VGTVQNAHNVGCRGVDINACWTNTNQPCNDLTQGVNAIGAKACVLNVDKLVARTLNVTNPGTHAFDLGTMS